MTPDDVNIGIVCAVLLSVLAIIGYVIQDIRLNATKRTMNQNLLSEGLEFRLHSNRLNAQDTHVTDLERVTDSQTKRLNDHWDEIRGLKTRAEKLERAAPIVNDFMRHQVEVDKLTASQIDGIYSRLLADGTFKPVERRSTRRNGGTLGQVENIAHETSRKRRGSR